MKNEWLKKHLLTMYQIQENKKIQFLPVESSQSSEKHINKLKQNNLK